MRNYYAIMAAKLPGSDDGQAEASEPLPSDIDILPRAVPRDVSRGGYDCEFVEPPPNVLQTECSVCLQILKEPCLISCCGHKFCRECIERIEKDKKPCALCNEPDFTFMRERGLERSLKDLEVWCSYRKKGCEWKGKLGKLEEHLNRDPSPENQLNGCQFVAVECTHKCGEWFQRHHIATHETQQCKKRPYSCDHCRDYHSTFEDVIKVHYPQCGKYPVACPNDCDEYKFERQKLESHLKEECPLVLVDCPFSYAGCETKLPRKDMPDHMKESTTHLTLMATTTQQLLKENQQLQQKVIEREDESRKNMTAVQTSLQELNMSVVKELQNENEELKKSLETVNASLQELVNKQQVTEKEMGALKEEVRKQKLEVQRLVNQSGFPVDYHVKLTDEEVYLPPFYTHPPNGYRMRVRVEPNGCGKAKGTHVSIFIYMMQGPFDNYLKWPFRGDIIIQIVNQVGNHHHVEKIIEYNAGRVTGKEGANWGNWGGGYQQFLARHELQYNAKRQTQYLKDNTLHIRIMKVTLH